MTCEFDRDLIALHAGGDLEPEAVSAVDEHLLACGECRHLLAQYRQGIEVVAADGAEVLYPGAERLVHRRPVWRWAVAAVLALVFAGTVGLMTGSPAVAALLRSFGIIQVREMSADESRQFQADMEARWKGGVIVRKPVAVTIEEAEAAVDYPVLQPRYLPDGLRLTSVHIVRGGTLRNVLLIYSDGRLHMEQFPPGETHSLQMNLPEGASEAVTVGGQPGVLVRGTWGIGPGEKYVWTPDSPVSLTFTRGIQVVRITIRQKGYPAEELIKIAESLE